MIHPSRPISTTLLIAAAAAAQTVVSPADRAGLEGSSSTSYPLGRAHCRLQQLLGDLPATTFAVSGHAYRRDAIVVRGQIDGFRARVSVHASISPNTPATASATFAANRGAQVQRLLDGVWLSFPATDRPAIDPAPAFELRIPYATPFTYPGAGTVCLETVVDGNDVGGQPDRNFSVYHDAHEGSAGGRSSQPGFRFGGGCPANGAGTAAYCAFELHRDAQGSVSLDIAARYGVPSTTAGPALSILMAGLRPVAWTWPWRTDCTVLAPPQVSKVLGSNDDRGHWNGGESFGGLRPLTVVHAQILSLQPATGEGTLSDGSRLTVPLPAPPQLGQVRVAHGSDITSPTGTVSASVPVIELF